MFNNSFLFSYFELLFTIDDFYIKIFNNIIYNEYAYTWKICQIILYIQNININNNLLRKEFWVNVWVLSVLGLEEGGILMYAYSVTAIKLLSYNYN